MFWGGGGLIWHHLEHPSNVMEIFVIYIMWFFFFFPAYAFYVLLLCIFNVLYIHTCLSVSEGYFSSYKGVALTVMPSKEVKVEIIHSELSCMCSVGILSCCLGNRPPAIYWYDIPLLCLFWGDFYLAHQWMRFRSRRGGVWESVPWGPGALMQFTFYRCVPLGATAQHVPSHAN